MSNLSIEEIDKVCAIVDNLKLDVKLVTPCGQGSQFVQPESIDVQDDGTITVVVKAWKDKSYK